jgi:predicted acylesterase/phospholipase RssA
MTIKHLVISGGGPSGLLSYGVASHLAKKGFWKLADIKSMYGCSIGAYIGFLLSLGYDWDWLDDYFIKRPWEKLVAASTTRLTEIYEKKCLLNEHFYTDAIRPLLRAKDLNDNITLAEFYEYTKIDLHMYAANINAVKLEKIDISHKTHPDLSIIQALRMTMAVPIIFEPIFIDEGCFIDGGVLNNFPLNDCIEQQKCDTDEILALKNIWQDVKQQINEKSSMFDFLLLLIKKAVASIDTDSDQPDIKYTVRCLMEDLESFDKWAEALNSSEKRKKIIEKGHSQADLFLAYVSKK